MSEEVNTGGNKKFSYPKGWQPEEDERTRRVEEIMKSRKPIINNLESNIIEEKFNWNKVIIFLIILSVCLIVMAVGIIINHMPLQNNNLKEKNMQIPSMVKIDKINTDVEYKLPIQESILNNKCVDLCQAKGETYYLYTFQDNKLICECYS